MGTEPRDDSLKDVPSSSSGCGLKWITLGIIIGPLVIASIYATYLVFAKVYPLPHF